MVDRHGFQSTLVDSESDGAAGISIEAMKPIAAARQATTAASMADRRPPASCPMRIATNVPASTRPVPPMISSLRRCCGRIAYFTGPKNVECTPIANRHPSRVQTEPRAKPARATPMMSTSAPFRMRAIRVLSIESASCPAIAESRKYGRMNTPVATIASISADIGVIPTSA